MQAHFKDRHVYFRVITLREPSHSAIRQSDDDGHGSRSAVPRQANVMCYLDQRHSENFWHFVVDLRQDQIVQEEKLDGRHSHVDAEDFEKFEKACMKDARVIKAIETMKLPKEAIVMVEPVSDPQ